MTATTEEEFTSKKATEALSKLKIEALAKLNRPKEADNKTYQIILKLKDKIQELQENKVSLKTIHETLQKEAGLKIGVQQFQKYYFKARGMERKKSPGRPPKTDKQ